MGIIANILITATVAIASIIGAYNYLPLSFIEKFGPGIENLGSTITTIAATDTLRDSRSTINTNFSNLNSDKMEGSTTSVASITTLSGLTTASNLVTVGALSSGSLASGFTAVTVPRGGTGSTTLSQYQLLLGNGVGTVTTTNGWGTSGQFLQSQGAGEAPSWQTSSIDQAAAYTWTGQHDFNAGATSTSATTTSLYVSGHASTSRITTNSLGVGIATTTNNNLQVVGNIQANAISLSGGCGGCPMAYDASSTVFSVSSGTTTYASNIPVTSNMGVGKFNIIGGAGTDFSGDIIIFRNGKTASVVQIENNTNDGRAIYSFIWSGASLEVGETSDNTTSIEGIMYWYK